MRTPPTSARSPEPPTAKSERTQTSGKTLQPLWSASRSLAREERCQFTDDRPLGIHDPAAVEGTDDEKLRAFNKAFRELDARLKIFTGLRLEMLDESSSSDSWTPLARCAKSVT